MQGKKSTPHRDPTDPPRRRANKRRGHGTYATDRPPIIHILSRSTGEERCWVVAHADGLTCKGIIAEAIPPDGTLVYSDEWRSYHGMGPAHATVAHGTGEWARDDDGDGQREVHCNTCEGAGASLRTFLRPFRGVHKTYLHEYVATYEALVNAKRVTSALICRMCWPPPPVREYWI